MSERAEPETTRAAVQVARRPGGGATRSPGRPAPRLEALQRMADQSASARTARGYRELLGHAAQPGDAPVQRVKVYNHEERLYINDQDGDPAPQGYQQVPAYSRDWRRPPWTQVSPLITRVNPDVFDALRGHFRNVGPDEWNEPVATVGGLYTEAMSSCSSIGLRGWADGQLYSALYHNTGTDQTPQDLNNHVIRPLLQEFGQNGLPPFTDLTNVKFFAIGGSQTSDRTCTSIVEAFQAFLPTGWDREFLLFPRYDDTLTKNALVDSAGNITYSLEGTGV